jgi:hypothetical protein
MLGHRPAIDKRSLANISIRLQFTSLGQRDELIGGALCWSMSLASSCLHFELFGPLRLHGSICQEGHAM